MTAEFNRRVLLKVVAQICQMVGFHKIMTSPLHILTDILANFISSLGRTAQHYAEHCGRSCSNLNDLSLAFFDSNIKPSDLAEFLKNVSPLPQCILIPKYPIAKVSVTCDESQSLQGNSDEHNKNNQSNNNERRNKNQCRNGEHSNNNQCNSNEHREGLKIKISLSKIKAATKSKRNKSMKNKKKRKNKRSRSRS